MLARRLRCWPNIDPTLVQYHVFDGLAPYGKWICTRINLFRLRFWWLRTLILTWRSYWSRMLRAVATPHFLHVSRLQWVPAQNICKTFVQRRPNVMHMFCVCWGAGHTVTEGAGVDTRWPLTDLGLSPFPLLSICTILGQYRGCQFQAISSICPVKHPVWYAVPIVSAGSLSRLAQGLHVPL